MKSLICTKKKRYPLYLWFVGVLAGFVNGFLGAGGGIVLVFAFAALYKDESRVKDVFAMTVASILPISVVSTISYIFNADADYSGMGRFIIPAVIGGIIGGYLTDKVKTSSLKLVFAVVTVIAGINMMMR